MEKPASTGSETPVIHFAWSETRKAIASEMSDGCRICTGIAFCMAAMPSAPPPAIACSASSAIAAFMVMPDATPVGARAHLLADADQPQFRRGVGEGADARVGDRPHPRRRAGDDDRAAAAAR